MKKGFTMIELVFVIVILGILASLAVPKLAATRDDAEAAKAAVEMKDVITQFTAYYTVNGTFKPTNGTSATNTSTNGTISEDDMKKISATYEEAAKRPGNNWTKCVKFTLNNGDNTNPASIKVAKADSSANSSFCSAVRGTQAYKDWSTMTNGIQVGGSGIFKEETTTK
ncbi:type II secretion system protein [Campylobacter hyointestinalis]|uniref:Type II secretion/transformation system, G protein n=1 Tax=Campylobacter hyointestinalis subsp. hyointestinalis TaxID=91352 RepID=A0A855NBY7_CAMHY|nr:type II secretion system protein [Campylobacter hyointestinalis]PPB59749.1 hypothetical protein CDQ70_03095 [Campylobacter hyointestinalis subsp. hyointestinalis]PPB64610.1 hypothetical protein CDQ74_00270 [Campylobacter hyointestinalis subsp. hyointestinalis]PPB72414.1 hypothetical protein CDQ78_02315 [Campylobacter hyointestinalis subsp. hyointestinalis]